MRVGLLKALFIVISLGMLPLPALVSSAIAEGPETCADGKPCPTDAELEDSCSDAINQMVRLSIYHSF